MHWQRQGPSAYEFGVKVSVATTINHAKGGEFVTHVKALPGNPFDSHILILDLETKVRNTLKRILTDNDTAATTRRPITSSGSSSPARHGA